MKCRILCYSNLRPRLVPLLAHSVTCLQQTHCFERVCRDGGGLHFADHCTSQPGRHPQHNEAYGQGQRRGHLHSHDPSAIRRPTQCASSFLLQWLISPSMLSQRLNVMRYTAPVRIRHIAVTER